MFPALLQVMALPWIWMCPAFIMLMKALYPLTLIYRMLILSCHPAGWEQISFPDRVLIIMRLRWVLQEEIQI